MANSEQRDPLRARTCCADGYTPHTHPATNPHPRRRKNAASPFYFQLHPSHAPLALLHSTRLRPATAGKAFIILQFYILPRPDAYGLDDILRYALEAAQTLMVWTTSCTTLRRPPELCPAWSPPSGEVPQGGGGLPKQPNLTIFPLLHNFKFKTPNETRLTRE